MIAAANPDYGSTPPNVKKCGGPRKGPLFMLTIGVQANEGWGKPADEMVDTDPAMKYPQAEC